MELLGSTGSPPKALDNAAHEQQQWMASAETWPLQVGLCGCCCCCCCIGLLGRPFTGLALQGLGGACGQLLNDSDQFSFRPMPAAPS